MNNRKARLLLGVPVIKLGKISEYRISNRFWIRVYPDGSVWSSFRRASARQNRARIRLNRRREEARQKWAKLGLHMDPAHYTPELFGGDRRG